MGGKDLIFYLENVHFFDEDSSTLRWGTSGNVNIPSQNIMPDGADGFM